MCFKAFLDPVPFQASDTLADVMVWVARGTGNDHIPSADAVEARCNVFCQYHILGVDRWLHGRSATLIKSKVGTISDYYLYFPSRQLYKLASSFH